MALLSGQAAEGAQAQPGDKGAQTDVDNSQAEAKGAEDGGDGGGDGGDALERPDWLPEEAWSDKGYDPAKHLEHLRAGARPETPDSYELPEKIEGIDMDEAKGSPLLVGLRAAAHKAGLSNEEFAGVASDMLTEAHKTMNEAEAAEMAKLGDNAKTRLDNLNNWLGTALPADQAKAVARLATTADSVAGLEALMNRGARKTGTSTETTTGRKTKSEIEVIMQSKAYNGSAAERDPAVIAEVDQWFKDEARINPRKKAAA